MERINNVVDAFLDGFGSLGAIFAPAVRPGSMENLIQEPLDLSSDARAASYDSVRFRIGADKAHHGA
jgi:hypothetical protein